MNHTPLDAASHTPDATNAPVGETATTDLPKATPPKSKNRFESAQPVLEKLFELYPALFGARFVPLKLGIFQELMAAHPDVFKRNDLKTALGVHTRSTRYLQAVASGLKRHDLAGQPVEDVAPEHVYLSVVELFTRRQARTEEDLTPKLRNQLIAAFEASGLARQDYLARIGTPPEAIQTVLDDALDVVEQRRARHAALRKAFESSGQSVEAFADMMGMKLTEVKAALA
ncbi:ProQ/FINO family protein [Rhodoferax sp.]|uniref:ProQ/FINO family protein n=1 Tax=Rhodoferax sp. TaxID=50421 RepID=UPI0026204B43|nr:ProQ/FINO family protein [Rhodoferax sp.]MDD2809688.1 ProQ/FINO family protein [Rhodoferax sp.]MDD4943240.1 ProQ/FINO family protein [Rhodoferax sp.]MDD5480718.1 ProQ/FINO family protein [Rhodoferax sp.]